MIIDQETSRRKDTGVRWRGRAQSVQQVGRVQSVQQVARVRHETLTRVGKNLSRKVEQGVGCRQELVSTWSIGEELAGVVWETIENGMREVRVAEA